MNHTTRKPPPPGQGFLYGEASSQPVFAGINITVVDKKIGVPRGLLFFIPILVRPLLIGQLAH